MSKILDYKNSIQLRTGFFLADTLSFCDHYSFLCPVFPAQFYLPSVLIHFHKQIKAESQMRYATLLSIIHSPKPLSESINTHAKEGGQTTH